MNPEAAPEELNGHPPRQRLTRRQIVSDMVRAGHVQSVHDPEPLEVPNPPKKDEKNESNG
jgi:hypothetical protein